MYTQAEASRLRENVERLTGVILPQNIRCEKAPGLCVSVTAEGGSIAAEDLSALSRGFFLAARAVKENTLPLNVKQERHFHSVGAMVDMSRGAVMTVGAVKRYINELSALGMNFLMLYTEDTYEVPEYPYFGYLRGRYTQDELREILCGEHGRGAGALHSDAGAFGAVSAMAGRPQAGRSAGRADGGRRGCVSLY